MPRPKPQENNAKNYQGFCVPGMETQRPLMGHQPGLIGLSCCVGTFILWAVEKTLSETEI